MPLKHIHQFYLKSVGSQNSGACSKRDFGWDLSIISAVSSEFDWESSTFETSSQRSLVDVLNSNDWAPGELERADALD